MVRLTARDPMTIYRVMDAHGSAIGEIRQPTSFPVIGRGAETVLLVRNEKGVWPSYAERATAA
jgi:hypothetical protein